MQDLLLYICLEKNNPSGCCMLHKVRDAALFFISIQRVKMTTDSSPGG